MQDSWKALLLAPIYMLVWRGEKSKVTKKENNDYKPILLKGPPSSTSLYVGMDFFPTLTRIEDRQYYKEKYASLTYMVR